MANFIFSLLGLIVEILVLIIIALGVALCLLHVVTNNLHGDFKGTNAPTARKGAEVVGDTADLAVLETLSATTSSLLKHYMTEAAVATSQVAEDTRMKLLEDNSVKLSSLHRLLLTKSRQLQTAAASHGDEQQWADALSSSDLLLLLKVHRLGLEQEPSVEEALADKSIDAVINNPALRHAIWRLVEFIVCEYVEKWYVPCVRNNYAVPNSVRASMEHIIASIAERAARADWPGYLVKHVITPLTDGLQVIAGALMELRAQEQAREKSKDKKERAKDKEKEKEKSGVAGARILTDMKLVWDECLMWPGLHEGAQLDPQACPAYLNKWVTALLSRTMKKQDFGNDIIRTAITDMLVDKALMPTVATLHSDYVNRLLAGPLATATQPIMKPAEWAAAVQGSSAAYLADPDYAASLARAEEKKKEESTSDGASVFPQQEWYGTYWDDARNIMLPQSQLLRARMAAWREERSKSKERHAQVRRQVMQAVVVALRQFRQGYARRQALLARKREDRARRAERMRAAARDAVNTSLPGQQQQQDDDAAASQEYVHLPLPPPAQVRAVSVSTHTGGAERSAGPAVSFPRAPSLDAAAADSAPGSLSRMSSVSHPDVFSVSPSPALSAVGSGSAVGVAALPPPQLSRLTSLPADALVGSAASLPATASTSSVHLHPVPAPRLALSPFLVHADKKYYQQMHPADWAEAQQHLRAADSTFAQSMGALRTPPTAHVAGAVTQFDPKPFVCYDVCVYAHPYRWVVRRRYNHFVELHDTLRKLLPNYPLALPKKRLFGAFDPEFVQTRRVALEEYVCALLRLPDAMEQPCTLRFLQPSLSSGVLRYTHAAATTAAAGISAVAAVAVPASPPLEKLDRLDRAASEVHINTFLRDSPRDMEHVPHADAGHTLAEDAAGMLANGAAGDGLPVVAEHAEPEDSSDDRLSGASVRIPLLCVDSDDRVATSVGSVGVMDSPALSAPLSMGNENGNRSSNGSFSVGSAPAPSAFSLRHHSTGGGGNGGGEGGTPRRSLDAVGGLPGMPRARHLATHARDEDGAEDDQAEEEVLARSLNGSFALSAADSTAESLNDSMYRDMHAETLGAAGALDAVSLQLFDPPPKQPTANGTAAGACGVSVGAVQYSTEEAPDEEEDEDEEAYEDEDEDDEEDEEEAIAAMQLQQAIASANAAALANAAAAADFISPHHAFLLQQRSPELYPHADAPAQPPAAQGAFLFPATSALPPPLLSSSALRHRTSSMAHFSDAVDAYENLPTDFFAEGPVVPAYERGAPEMEVKGLFGQMVRTSTPVTRAREGRSLDESPPAENLRLLSEDTESVNTSGRLRRFISRAKPRRSVISPAHADEVAVAMRRARTRSVAGGASGARDAVLSAVECADQLKLVCWFYQWEDARYRRMCRDLDATIAELTAVRPGAVAACASAATGPVEPASPATSTASATAVARAAAMPEQEEDATHDEPVTAPEDPQAPRTPLHVVPLFSSLEALLAPLTHAWRSVTSKQATEALVDLANACFQFEHQGFMRRRMGWVIKKAIHLTGTSTFAKVVTQALEPGNIAGWLTWLTDLIWPGGVLAYGTPPTDSEVVADRQLVHLMLDRLIKSYTATIFGKEAAEDAAVRVYFFLHIRPLMVNLLLRALDGLLVELFPELQHEIDRLHPGVVPLELVEESCKSRLQRDAHASVAMGMNDPLLVELLRDREREPLAEDSDDDGELSAHLRVDRSAFTAAALVQELDQLKQPLRVPAARHTGGAAAVPQAPLTDGVRGMVDALLGPMLGWLGYAYVGHDAARARGSSAIRPPVNPDAAKASASAAQRTPPTASTTAADVSVAPKSPLPTVGASSQPTASKPASKPVASRASLIAAMIPGVRK